MPPATSGPSERDFTTIETPLSPEFAIKVKDLTLRLPNSNPYGGTVKTQIVRRTNVSELRKLQQLFSKQDLGDQKPSQLLRMLQQLLRDWTTIIDSTFLPEFYLQRLPNNVKIVLASTPYFVSLANLAEQAHKAIVKNPQLSADMEQL